MKLFDLALNFKFLNKLPLVAFCTHAFSYDWSIIGLHFIKNARKLYNYS